MAPKKLRVADELPADDDCVVDMMVDFVVGELIPLGCRLSIVLKRFL
jgi:hypothetical protein